MTRENKAGYQIISGSDENDTWGAAAWLSCLASSLCLFIPVCTSFRQVREGTALQQRQMDGKLLIHVGPKFASKIPLLSTWGEEITLGDMVRSVRASHVLTTDGQNLTINSIVTFCVSDPKAYTIKASSSGTAFPAVVEGYLTEFFSQCSSTDLMPGLSFVGEFKRKAPGYTAESDDASHVEGQIQASPMEHAHNPREIAKEIQETLKPIADRWGLEVIDLKFTDIQPANAAKFQEVQTDGMRRRIEARAIGDTSRLLAEQKAEANKLASKSTWEEALIASGFKVDSELTEEQRMQVAAFNVQLMLARINQDTVKASGASLITTQPGGANVSLLMRQPEGTSPASTLQYTR